MNKKVKVAISNEDIHQAIIELSKIDGLNIQIANTKEHYNFQEGENLPIASLSPTELVTLIVSFSSLTASALGLATAILNLKKTNEKTVEDEEKEIKIYINGLEIEKHKSVDELTNEIIDHIGNEKDL